MVFNTTQQYFSYMFAVKFYLWRKPEKNTMYPVQLAKNRIQTHNFSSDGLRFQR